MTFIKRISQILTPPPKFADKSEEHVQDPDAPLASNITPLLIELLLDRPIDQMEQHKHLEELKRIASHYGITWTAGDIFDSIERLPKERDGMPLKKARGYELAADFYRQAISHSIRSIGSEKDQAKFDELSAMISNFLDCEFHAMKLARGLESFFRAVNSLMLRGCDRVSNHKIFLQLAVQASATGHHWIIEKRERLDREYNRWRKKMDEEDSPTTPEPPRPDALISYELIEHMETFSNQTARMAAAKGQLKASAAIPFDKLLDPEFQKSRAHQAHYLQSLAKLVGETGPGALQGAILEALAITVNAEQPGSGVPFHESATQVFESQGSMELQFGFHDLAKELFQKALANAQQANLEADFHRMQERLQELAKAGGRS